MDATKTQAAVVTGRQWLMRQAELVEAELAQLMEQHAPAERIEDARSRLNAIVEVVRGKSDDRHANKPKFRNRGRRFWESVPYAPAVFRVFA